MSDRRGYKINEIEFSDEREEQCFKDHLEYVLKYFGKDLYKTACGITRLVIEKGINGLSEKQRNVFQIHVLEPYTQKKCINIDVNNCIGGETDNIPWDEMFEHIPKHKTDGICCGCKRSDERREKD